MRFIFSDLQKYYNSNYDFLLNYNISFKPNILSWGNYKNREIFDTYEEYFHWIINCRQYSFNLHDGSALQLYYEGDGNTLKKASLAFLPLCDDNLQYFRFDLDYEASRDYCHTCYHVHFGYKTEKMRLTLFHFPKPSQFIQFVKSFVYEIPVEKFKKDKFYPDLNKLAENPTGIISGGEKYNHFLKLVSE